MKTKAKPFLIDKWTPGQHVWHKHTGGNVRVLCVDGPNLDNPVVGIHQVYSDVAVTEELKPGDLEVVEPAEMAWMNYNGNSLVSTVYKTKKDADEAASEHRIACFEVEKTWQHQ